jgi:CheY-like chemotaxis protein
MHGRTNGPQATNSHGLPAIIHGDSRSFTGQPVARLTCATAGRPVSATSLQAGGRGIPGQELHQGRESHRRSGGYQRKQGFDVTVCPTGPDALAAFDRNGADLILLDLTLPGPPGTEVCRSLRERSNVPVIMLSARDTEVDKAVGLELGADDYVTKPFTWRELATRIQTVLYRRGTD